MTQEDFLLQMADFLQSAAIPFMLAGSHSSSIHGQPRTTNDIDLIIEPMPEQLSQLLALLGEHFYVSRQSAFEALSRRAMFNVIDFENGWKADLIIRKSRPFSIEEFSRRQMRTVYGRSLPIASPEDVILSKLEWNKITPSDQQLRDVVNVAAVQWPTLDRSYLRRWAVELGVTEKLEQMLSIAEAQQPDGSNQK